jgi:hypothetical protein
MFPLCRGLQSIRLMAAVVAKNAVGSSWRKTLGTREWSRVPAGEKAAVRAASLRLLFSEASERVAIQLGLLITNIARWRPVSHPESGMKLPVACSDSTPPAAGQACWQAWRGRCLGRAGQPCRPGAWRCSCSSAACSERKLLAPFRFDFPSSWASLLADLAQAAAWEAPTNLAGKERALFTLKNVVQSLKGKRFVVEAPKSEAQLTPQGGVLCLGIVKLEAKTGTSCGCISALDWRLQAVHRTTWQPVHSGPHGLWRCIPNRSRGPHRGRSARML